MSAMAIYRQTTSRSSAWRSQASCPVGATSYNAVSGQLPVCRLFGISGIARAIACVNKGRERRIPRTVDSPRADAAPIHCTRKHWLSEAKRVTLSRAGYRIASLLAAVVAFTTRCELLRGCSAHPLQIRCHLRPPPRPKGRSNCPLLDPKLPNLDDENPSVGELLDEVIVIVMRSKRR